jgi:hypothetical protein
MRATRLKTLGRAFSLIAQSHSRGDGKDTRALPELLYPGEGEAGIYASSQFAASFHGVEQDFSCSVS